MKPIVMRAAALLALIVVNGFGSDFAASAAQPGVTISASQVTATGISPGADVVFFGAGFEPKRYYAIVHRWAVVVSDADHDGVVSYALETPVTWNALWVVADLRNGHYTVASTPGYPTMHARLAQRDFKRDASGEVSRFIYSRSAANFLYIVPGGGAWKLLARDGDENDADLTGNGLTAIDLSRVEPLGGTKERPRAFTPGGTLFVIDSSRLDLLELKIDGAMLGGAHQ